MFRERQRSIGLLYKLCKIWPLLQYAHTDGGTDIAAVMVPRNDFVIYINASTFLSTYTLTLNVVDVARVTNILGKLIPRPTVSQFQGLKVCRLTNLMLDGNAGRCKRVGRETQPRSMRIEKLEVLESFIE